MTKGGRAMAVYRVTGVADYVLSCMCPDCDGHERSVQINVLVSADDAELAAEYALRGKEPMTDWGWVEQDGEWCGDGPEVVEAGEDVHMVLIGAPTLFDIGAYSVAKTA
jgi:hypothetical protein